MYLLYQKCGTWRGRSAVTMPMKFFTNRLVLVIGALALGMILNAQTQGPKMDIPTNLKPYVMVYMLKGPKFKAEGSPEFMAEIAKHLTWMKKMNAEKKLVLAGPMRDEGRVLGISVLNVANKEEAKKLLQSEPSVMSGHMTYEVQTCVLPDLGSVKMTYSE